MTKTTRRRLTVPIAGIFVLQAIMPVVLAAFLFLVKSEQRNFVETNRDNKYLFQEIRIGVGNIEAKYMNHDELLYKGVLYDIRSVTISNNEYVILARADKKETCFYKHNTLNNSSSPLTTESLHPLPFYFLYFEQQDEWSTFSVWRNSSFNLLQLCKLSHIAKQIPKPPPRDFC